MKLLKQRILEDGRSLVGGVLKVDSFINHQLDPNLMKSIAEEFVQRFSGVKFNKIITIEASGIAPAIMVGYVLGLPVLFAKKKVPSTMEGMIFTNVYSFTKNKSYQMCVSKEFLNEGDRVLFIDDFLAHGNAAMGIIELAKQVNAEVVGMGFIIEKAFQNGAKRLSSLGVQVESLAIIESLDGCKIEMR